jgi:iron complex transport system permease protein
VTSMLTRKRFLLLLAGYGLLSVVILAGAPFFGSESLGITNITNSIFFHIPHVDTEIFFYQRIPRVLLAFLVGGSLALAGSSLQVVLRNPLAEPFVLGISGAGAVGAVIIISVPGLSIYFGPFSSVQLFSLLGCILCVGAIYWFARSPLGVSMTTILLAGVTINILCGAVIMLVRYIVSPQLLVAMDRWMMGGLDVVGYRELSALLPLLLPGILLLFLQGHSLNQLAFSEEMAMGHGVNVGSVQKQVFLGTGLTTAAAVSLAGPIGFVGLIIPHAVRRLSGVDHRVVLPASFCLGGAFLTLCDLFARTVVAPTEMPVGIITAIIGGPVFFRILLKRSRNM